MRNKPSNKSNIYRCSCVRSASTNSPISFHRGKPTSDSLRQWMSMHGTCTQLLPDLYQITTCDGHCWHCVESRGYPGRIKTALAAVYYQQSPALASWPTKHTGEADRGKKKKRPWGQGLIVDVHDDASCLQCRFKWFTNYYPYFTEWYSRLTRFWQKTLGVFL